MGESRYYILISSFFNFSINYIIRYCSALSCLRGASARTLFSYKNQETDLKLSVEVYGFIFTLDLKKQRRHNGYERNKGTKLESGEEGVRMGEKCREQCKQLRNFSKSEAEDGGKQAVWTEPACQATEIHTLPPPLHLLQGGVNLLWLCSISHILKYQSRLTFCTI